MADYRSRAARPASSSTTYNPYGRGHLKLTGGTSGGAWRSDDVLATGESPALRQLRGVLRRLWTAATGGSFSPQTFQFIGLCALWYTTSALSSNTGKVILNRFRYPVTLTIVQFAFVSALSLLCMSPVVRMSHLRTPSRAILRTTLPMGMFQVGGHIFSSLAISRIPVSTVHTIKALSPLFTVAAYVLLFGVSYNAKTYFSLVPLTLGVMLACSFDVSAGNTVGVACAFGSAIVFVTSNIFFKKVMPSEGGAAHKLDKLNMLFYASSTAFVLMVPIWLWTDLPALLGPADTHVTHPARGHDHGSALGLTTAFCANGAVHFAQTALAFVLLARTSPVTYSIASLIKRVAVIVLAVIWFAQPVHPVQGAGIALTFLGLWLYNGAKGDVAAGERRARRVERARNLALPSSRSELADEGAPASHMQDPVPQEQQAQVSFAPGPLSPTRARRTTLPPLATDAQSLSYAQHRAQAGHPALPLHITITPPSAHPASAGAPAKGAFAGATPLRADSYPSPPLSLDSPPPEAADPEPTSHATAVAMR